MMFWIGSEADIIAAEALAASEVVGRPEFIGGRQIPERGWVTLRWATPLPTADGRFVIPAYPGLTPTGVETVSQYTPKIQEETPLEQ